MAYEKSQSAEQFRTPRWRLPWPQLYAETLEQAVYAEELGFDSIWLSDDILAAIAGSQQRLGYEELVFWARPPGMPAAQSTASLELIARHVLPALHEVVPDTAGGSTDDG
jgi:hypothetical protein